MADVFSSRKRRQIMQAVRREGTMPELQLAALLKDSGIPYEAQTNLFGRPDFYFPDHRIAVFVHGCFWHGHTCRKGACAPKTNTEYWIAKVKRNRTRDHRVARILRGVGIGVYVVRECELRAGRVPTRLFKLLRAEPLLQRSAV
jgi:DNA mismatch endonuclease, patch repair protein